jgi:hypothetical protein
MARKQAAGTSHWPARPSERSVASNARKNSSVYISSDSEEEEGFSKCRQSNARVEEAEWNGAADAEFNDESTSENAADAHVDVPNEPQHSDKLRSSGSVGSQDACDDIGGLPAVPVDKSDTFEEGQIHVRDAAQFGGSKDKERSKGEEACC